MTEPVATKGTSENEDFSYLNPEDVDTERKEESRVAVGESNIATQQFMQQEIEVIQKEIREIKMKIEEANPNDKEQIQILQRDLKEKEKLQQEKIEILQQDVEEIKIKLEEVKKSNDEEQTQMLSKRLKEKEKLLSDTSERAQSASIRSKKNTDKYNELDIKHARDIGDLNSRIDKIELEQKSCKENLKKLLRHELQQQTMKIGDRISSSITEVTIQTRQCPCTCNETVKDLKQQITEVREMLLQQQKVLNTMGKLIESLAEETPKSLEKLRRKISNVEPKEDNVDTTHAKRTTRSLQKAQSFGGQTSTLPLIPLGGGVHVSQATVHERRQSHGSEMATESTPPRPQSGVRGQGDMRTGHRHSSRSTKSTVDMSRYDNKQED